MEGKSKASYQSFTKYVFSVKIQVYKSMEHTQFLPFCVPCKHVKIRFLEKCEKFKVTY